MRCLKCGLEIENPTEQEQEAGWHRHCIRNFFGTETFPYIAISEQELEELASSNADRGLTIPGVQKKLSLHHESGDGRGNRLTLVDYPAGYILKPQTKEYKTLPEAEYLTMQMSEVLGVKVVPFALVKLADSLAYITKRIDRDDKKRLAMEDFCQLSERLSDDKYKGSYEGCARIIKKYSSRATLDLSELFIRVVAAFVVGNSDMHLKNLSLIENAPASRVFGLSEAYDILPVNVVDKEIQEELALSLNGKNNRLRKKDFLELAEYCSIGKEAAEKMIAGVISKKDACIQLCKESLLDDEEKERMIQLITERAKRLG